VSVKGAVTKFMEDGVHAVVVEQHVHGGAELGAAGGGHDVDRFSRAAWGTGSS